MGDGVYADDRSLWYEISTVNSDKGPDPMGVRCCTVSDNQLQD